MELLTLKDAAARAGCSTKTLRNRIKSGELRAMMKDGKHGPTYFVPEAELVRMLAIETPGGRTSVPVEAAVSTDTTEISTPSPQGTASPPVAGVTPDLILRLTDKLEQQAQELGRFMAISERSETLENRERQLQQERDRLATELAEAKIELEIMRREQLRQGRRWFGIKRRSRDGQGSSTVSVVDNAGAR